MADQHRDAKGRYSDLEVGAVEGHFGHRARDQAELDHMTGTFVGAAIVLGIRQDRLRADIEAGMVRLGGFLWRRFPRTCRVVLRVTDAGLLLLQRLGIVKESDA